MFVYLAGALLVFVALLERIPGGWAEVIGRRRRRRQVPALDLSLDPKAVYTLWAGLIGRRRADAGDARHRSVSGAAAAVGAVGARRAASGWC